MRYIPIISIIAVISIVCAACGLDDGSSANPQGPQTGGQSGGIEFPLCQSVSATAIDETNQGAPVDGFLSSAEQAIAVYGGEWIGQLDSAQGDRIATATLTLTIASAGRVVIDSEPNGSSAEVAIESSVADLAEIERCDDYYRVETDGVLTIQGLLSATIRAQLGIFATDRGLLGQTIAADNILGNPPKHIVSSDESASLQLSLIQTESPLDEATPTFHGELTWLTVESNAGSDTAEFRYWGSLVLRRKVID